MKHRQKWGAKKVVPTVYKTTCSARCLTQALKILNDEERLMMDCLHSLAPNDEELLRLTLDEEPLPHSAREHLEQCPICQRRLSSYKRINSFLTSHLYRCQCPGATQLNFYCAATLPADERMSVAKHILDCPLCADDVADIRRTLANFDPFPAPVLSPPLLRWESCPLTSRKRSRSCRKGRSRSTAATALRC